MPELPTVREAFELQFDTRQREALWEHKLRDEKGRILDLGCGAASPLDGLMENEIVFVDCAEGNLRNLFRDHKAYMHQSEHIVADALHLPFRPDVFNAVAAPYLLDHITGRPRKTNVRRAISEMMIACKRTVVLELDRDSVECLKEAREALHQLRTARHKRFDFTRKIDKEESLGSVFIRIEMKKRQRRE